MKFEMKCTDDYGAINTIVFEEVTLPKILDNVTLFLRGAGFQLENLDYDLPSS